MNYFALSPTSSTNAQQTSASYAPKTQVQIPILLRGKLHEIQCFRWLSPTALTTTKMPFFSPTTSPNLPNNSRKCPQASRSGNTHLRPLQKISPNYNPLYNQKINMFQSQPPLFPKELARGRPKLSTTSPPAKTSPRTDPRNPKTRESSVGRRKHARNQWQKG